MKCGVRMFTRVSVQWFIFHIYPVHDSFINLDSLISVLTYMMDVPLYDLCNKNYMTKEYFTTVMFKVYINFEKNCIRGVV